MHKDKGISISEKHGVNPSLMQCFYCMRDVGVALLGKLPDDAEAPRRICLNKEPCDECKKFMKAGIILISVRDDCKEGDDDPYRTGAWVVVKEEALRRVVTTPDLVDHICKVRFAFMPDEAWDGLGLPREKEGETNAQG